MKHGLHPTIANKKLYTPTYPNTKTTSFQNQILRRYLGFTRTTPTHYVHALSGFLQPKQIS